VQLSDCSTHSDLDVCRRVPRREECQSGRGWQTVGSAGTQRGSARGCRRRSRPAHTSSSRRAGWASNAAAALTTDGVSRICCSEMSASGAPCMLTTMRTPAGPRRELQAMRTLAQSRFLRSAPESQIPATGPAQHQLHALNSTCIQDSEATLPVELCMHGLCMGGTPVRQ